MMFVRMNEEEKEKKEEKVGGNVKFKYCCTDTEPGLGDWALRLMNLVDVVTPVLKLGTRYLVRKHGRINTGTFYLLGHLFFFCDRFAQLSISSNPTQYNLA
jgi:hypothetical protein